MRVRISIALGALLAGGLQAQKTINPLAQTGLSGSPGGQTTILGNSTVGYTEALQEIRWTEYADQPCLLTITTGYFYGSPNPYRPELKICDWPRRSGSGLFPSVKELGSTTEEVASWKTVKFANNPRYFIRGVAVCKSSKDNNRIKGIRIYPAKVWTSPRAIDVINDPDEASRTNCGTWDAPAFCPANYIAVQLMVYHRPHQITGLGLTCRQIEY
ncbi:MAG: hypothetical protein ACKVZ0_21130 [Gemmatimonadales bacterium]